MISKQKTETPREMQIAEKARKRELETIVQTGLAGFVEVGNALQEIRDARLYRDEHDSFEAYCAKKWAFTASYGYRLIAVAEIANSVTDAPKNVTQALRLGAVPAEKRETVWKDANETAAAEHRAVTTQDIDDASAFNEGFSDFPNEEITHQSEGAKRMAEALPIATQLSSAINEAIRLAAQLASTSAREWLLTGGTSLTKSLRDALEHTRAARPVAECPRCMGDGCVTCLNTGWINASRDRALRKTT